MTARMPAPESGVTIRMYRHGHGDCFLLAFRRNASNDDPFYMLIDCGMKANSAPIKDRPLSDTITHIRDATGGKIDLVVVTHEHQDHVSGFPKPGEVDHPFRDIEIGALWLAWTENPEDEVANTLREAYGDKLLTLALAHHKLSRFSGVANKLAAETIGELLETETGHSDGADVLAEAGEMLGLEGGPDALFADAVQQRIPGKRYKERLQGLREIAGPNIEFLRPDKGPIALPGVEGVRVFPFGPPRDLDGLTKLNPRKGEKFHFGPFAVDEPGASLFAAFEGAHSGTGSSPFARRHRIEENSILRGPKKRRDPGENYLAATYRDTTSEARRIDGDWLGDAEPLALRLNSEVNNTSLVLMFELEQSGQTLLFTGDAQAGNWRSWAKLSWSVAGEPVTARDLMARCTFYKAGHHGSHNATLNGTLEDTHANLSWMGLGAYADRFCAMIPSNKVWAFGKTRPWRHPMPQIEHALMEKAENRVLVMHCKDSLSGPPESSSEAKAKWDAFQKRVRDDDAYIELDVFDSGP